MYCEEDISTANIRLILTNEADATTREFPISVPFLAASRELRLNQALDDTCRRILPLYGSQLFHVDFANRVNRFLGIYPVESQIRISNESVFNGSVQIIVKSSQIYNPSVSEAKEEDLVSTVGKTKKVKERTIQEALTSVKQWRRLYDTDDGTGKRKYTLDEAARIVGIAKKTLDDYYSLIRTAMNHNFNLERFKQNKIGILRKFVKIAKEEGQQGINAKMSQYLCDMDIDKFWAELNDL